MWKNRGGQKGGVSWATWAESKGYVCPRKPQFMVDFSPCMILPSSWVDSLLSWAVI